MRGPLVAVALVAAAFAAAAAALEPLPTPPGAFVELSDGSRKDVDQLKSAHAWALSGAGAGAPSGTWCCVPVWNGRNETKELWAQVTGTSAGVTLSTDPACGSAACAFPIAAVAFVNLCPGTGGAAACGAAAAPAVPAGSASGAAAGAAPQGVVAANSGPPQVATRSAGSLAANGSTDVTLDLPAQPAAPDNATAASNNRSRRAASDATTTTSAGVDAAAAAVAEAGGRSAGAPGMSMPLVGAFDGRMQDAAAARFNGSANITTPGRATSPLLNNEAPLPPVPSMNRSGGFVNETGPGPRMQVTVLHPGSTRSGAAAFSCSWAAATLGAVLASVLALGG